MKTVTEPVGICEFANVVFVIDGSGSVNDEDDKTFAESIQYSLDVIAAMAVGSTGVFASVVTFNEEAHVELELSQRYLMRTVIGIKTISTALLLFCIINY